MKRLLAPVAGLALAAATVGFGPSAFAGPSSTGLTHSNVHVCAAPLAGYAACNAIRHDTYVNGKPAPGATATPKGYGPADLQSAYGLPSALGGSVLTTAPVVAIVDAYDDPSAANDLGVYRSQFKLPSCSTANGCFRKVNQTGGTSLPRKNGGWAQEISLDLDMVSAACPTCRILLVEASSNSFSNLAAAVNYAASAPGVVAISNSYGGGDTSGANYPAYNTAASKGIAVTASTGDNGYGVESPASFSNVVAVGGTSLSRASNTRGWSETAWSGAGSGCSTVNANPGWQTSATSCAKKANADVSAVADPNTGVAVYDSTAYQGYVGWMVFGGTSASSPIVASVFAIANNLGTGTNTAKQAGSVLWAHTSSLNDVLSGSNGSCSPNDVWCTAQAGWDGPTGLGTPNGTGAF